MVGRGTDENGFDLDFDVGINHVKRLDVNGGRLLTRRSVVESDISDLLLFRVSSPKTISLSHLDLIRKPDSYKILKRIRPCPQHSCFNFK